MASREDWPNNKIVCFRIAETFTEERDGKKWTSKTAIVGSLKDTK
jgi:hypothetical protein